MNARNVLIVDDEASMRRVLEIMLSRMNYRTWSAADGSEAFRLLQEQSFDLVVTDLRMPGMDGIELLRKLREAGLSLPVIMMTAHGSIESAIEAMRLGACDYLLRPFDVETLELAMRRVFAQSDLLRRNAFLAEQSGDSGFVGGSEVSRKVRQQVAQVAPTQATVLITGETGTGKEVVARAIHRASTRRDALFVPINCAAIPADILESELFGHEKGAFTGALRDRVGKFELADGGTIFLDEVTEMPAPLQAKLLRVLQEGTVERVGSNRTLELDLRVIAATNRRPVDAIRAQRLREDLYYRLNVFAIDLPPLRERRDDIEALAQHFVADIAGAARAVPITPPALAHLRAYDWPGNVRELRNLIERALVLSGGGALDAVHFPIEGGGPAAPAPTVIDDMQRVDLNLDQAVGEIESRYIREALRRCGNNKTRAAALLNVSERTIWNKLKRYGIDS
ncbi:sigma-54-dependent transcriptional regulator [Solimonas marina]|uniref:Sigma-54-dependent Fis family transcriptional regulator n=1 Tax=Solimonas marina TaxID=2714601 RepID=A0A969WB30_9GAMM|nr:sigma-54 dependent transcriptional regulator [Solimonas marina]NKF22825.1 sigma-54-dependent Fis family transcriptional regulator [Solimonas marina]